VAAFTICSAQLADKEKLPSSFEVVSFRLAPPDSGAGWAFSQPGESRFTATNASLKLLIQVAYGIEESQIQNGPSWIDSQRYDIAALPPDGYIPKTKQELQPLLQNMLADRLKLTVHWETKNHRGYELVNTKVPTKMNPGLTQSTGGNNVFMPNRIGSDAMSMQTLTVMLSALLGSPVTDKTGLDGNYKIALKFAPVNAPDSPLPSIFTAIQEDLGLKLNPATVPTTYLVIDHVDRNPSAN
jgi:uncharacterized protein (TIGR03435 family)